MCNLDVSSVHPSQDVQKPDAYKMFFSNDGLRKTGRRGTQGGGRSLKKMERESQGERAKYYNKIAETCPRCCYKPHSFNTITLSIERTQKGSKMGPGPLPHNSDPVYDQIKPMLCLPSP